VKREKGKKKTSRGGAEDAERKKKNLTTEDTELHGGKREEGRVKKISRKGREGAKGAKLLYAGLSLYFGQPPDASLVRLLTRPWSAS